MKRKASSRIDSEQLTKKQKTENDNLISELVNLPDEITYEILKNLDINSLYALSASNKQFSTLFNVLNNKLLNNNLNAIKIAFQIIKNSGNKIENFFQVFKVFEPLILNCQGQHVKLYIQLLDEFYTRNSLLVPDQFKSQIFIPFIKKNYVKFYKIIKCINSETLKNKFLKLFDENFPKDISGFSNINEIKELVKERYCFKQEFINNIKDEKYCEIKNFLINQRNRNENFLKILSSGKVTKEVFNNLKFSDENSFVQVDALNTDGKNAITLIYESNLDNKTKVEIILTLIDNRANPVFIINNDFGNYETPLLLYACKTNNT